MFTPGLVLGADSVSERMNSAAEALLDTDIQTAHGIRLSDLVAGGGLLEAIGRVLDTGTAE